MAEKKIIISATEITEVIYFGSNLKSKGGKQEKNEVFIQDKAFEEVEKDGCILTSGKGELVGQYHIKNYQQRKKSRRHTVDELVVNNFHVNKCSIITLTFGDKNEGISANTGTSSVSPLEVGAAKVAEEVENGGDFQTQFEAFYNSIVAPGLKHLHKDTAETQSQYTDLAICNKEFKKFIQRMTYRYDGFKYVAVMGKQSNGNWHYHMICNIAYIRFAELKEIWGLGGAYIKKIGNKEQFAKSKNYLKKNMKEAATYLEGKKGYLASKGLSRNIELRSWVEKESNEYTKQARRLEEIKKEVDYTRKHIIRRELPITNPVDFYWSDDEKFCEFKYYTYPIDSTDMFPPVEMARKK